MYFTTQEVIILWNCLLCIHLSFFSICALYYGSACIYCYVQKVIILQGYVQSIKFSGPKKLIFRPRTIVVDMREFFEKSVAKITRLYCFCEVNSKSWERKELAFFCNFVATSELNPLS